MGELSSKFATPFGVMAALNRGFVSWSGERLSALRPFSNGGAGRKGEEPLAQADPMADAYQLL